MMWDGKLEMSGWMQCSEGMFTVCITLYFLNRTDRSSSIFSSLHLAMGLYIREMNHASP